MKRWRNALLILMLLLLTVNLVDLARERKPDDLLAAIGFAMIAWGLWRNPRGFRDAYGNDLTDDSRAAKLSMAGAIMVAASMVLGLVMAIQR